LVRFFDGIFVVNLWFLMVEAWCCGGRFWATKILHFFEIYFCR